jgi:hypothetical protein
MKKWILAAAVLLVFASAGYAKGKKWSTVADLTAGNDAKEVAVNQTIRTVQIECIEGTMIVNTFVVREGAARESFRIGRRFNVGDKQEIDLGRDRNVTGFRISDDGRGRYRVSVK